MLKINCSKLNVLSDDRESDDWHDEIREKVSVLNLTQRQQEKKINELVKMGKQKALCQLKELDGNTHHMTRLVIFSKILLIFVSREWKKNSRRIKVYLFYKSVKVTTVICPKKTPPNRRFCPKRGLNPSFFPFSRVISSRPNIIETVHVIIK